MFYKKIIKSISSRKLRLKVKREGGYAFSSSIRKEYLQKYNIKIGYGTYGGCFNPSNIPPNTEFGNYCSIAKDVKIFRANHPSDYFTLHPLFYNPVMGYVKNDLLSRPKLTIGHDVWIGDGTKILPSVMNIGNGAIIGAGTIVTKDVAAYSIVVGNPAKVIKKRFNDLTISKLESSKWWELDKQELINNKKQLEQLVDEQ